MARLRRDGRVLASAILPITGAEAWVLKIAHDEADPEAAEAAEAALVALGDGLQ